MTSRPCLSIGLCLVALVACNKPAQESSSQSSSAASESSVSTSEESSVFAEISAEPEPIYTVGRLGQRAGLWQLTQTLPEMEASYVTKVCVNDAQGETLAMTGQDLLDKPEMKHLTCSEHTVKRLESGADIDTVCKVNDSTLTSHIHVDIIGHDAFHQTAETRYTPASAGHGKQVTVTDAKRLGDCPDNMKAGDLTTHDGVHLKVGKILALSQKIRAQ